MKNVFIKSFFVVLCGGISFVSYSQIITQIIYPFAGNGYDAGMGYLYGGYSGDGGPATLAEFNGPQGIVLDDSGNLYIADDGNNVVRKVDTSGIITTFAGNGYGAGMQYFNYTGDGGPATDAELGNPQGLAIDAYGNIYIADGVCDIIRKVNRSGIISTFAGNGMHGYSGDGGPATSAELYNPPGLAVSTSGNVYIADLFNNRIRVIDTLGIIHTFAGNGFGTPFGGGYTGDGGPATAAELHYPHGIALDAFENVYIADEANSRIRKVNASGIMSTFAGDSIHGYSGDGGPAIDAEFDGPTGVVLDDSGNVFIADCSNNRIRKVNTSGIISTIAGNGYGVPSGGGYSGDGGPAINAELYYPISIAINLLGIVYISDSWNNRIRKVASGIYEISSDSVQNNLRIFPTPTNGLFTVSGVKKGQFVEIYNYLGQQLSKTFVNNIIMYFDISTKENGVYFIKIQNNNGSIFAVKKIVKMQ